MHLHFILILYFLVNPSYPEIDMPVVTKMSI
jgi:hypothetical protein